MDSFSQESFPPLVKGFTTEGSAILLFIMEDLHFIDVLILIFL